MRKQLFEKLRKEKDYVSLGWEFWNGFLLFTGKKKREHSQQWDSLSKQEKELCEQVR